MYQLFQCNDLMYKAKKISYITRKFISSKDWPRFPVQIMTKSLMNMFPKAINVFTWKFGWNLQILVRVHQWTNTGIKPEPQNKKEIVCVQKKYFLLLVKGRHHPWFSERQPSAAVIYWKPKLSHKLTCLWYQHNFVSINTVFPRHSTL